jgi:hypothetical protein
MSHASSLAAVHLRSPQRALVGGRRWDGARSTGRARSDSHRRLVTRTHDAHETERLSSQVNRKDNRWLA